MTELGVTIVWCAAQVTLFLALAAPVYLLTRRLHPRAGTVVALGSLGAVILLSLLAGSSWPRWEVGGEGGRGALTEEAGVKGQESEGVGEALPAAVA